MTSHTAALCSTSTLAHVHASSPSSSSRRSHTRAVQSQLALAIVRPSSEQWRAQTLCAWPRRVWDGVGGASGASEKSWMSESAPAVARNPAKEARQWLLLGV